MPCFTHAGTGTGTLANSFLLETSSTRLFLSTHVRVMPQQRSLDRPRGPPYLMIHTIITPQVSLRLPTLQRAGVYAPFFLVPPRQATSTTKKGKPRGGKAFARKTTLKIRPRTVPNRPHAARGTAAVCNAGPPPPRPGALDLQAVKQVSMKWRRKHH
ncbi:hypothetical protein LZ30DRAFT_719624 [Colletotrichum cereale]|nr:hypothetical protein LZ30DRAFT_719624 [Colletotrichum cereale]